jgi:ABC-type multidrug transport system fused ATPase/permease subunit
MAQGKARGQRRRSPAAPVSDRGSKLMPNGEEPAVAEKDVASAYLASGAARRAAFADLSRLLRIVSKPRWATPALIGVGLISSLAETVGISLILLFLYSALGELDTAASTEGLLGDALREATGWFDNSVEMACAILVLIIARGMLAFVYQLLSAKISEEISERTRNLIHRQYLTASYGYVQRHDQAQLMEVLGTESWLVAGAYGAVTRLIVASCSIFVFLIFLVSLSWQITLLAVIGSAITSLGLRRLANPARLIGKQVKQVNQQLGEHMLMTLQGMRTIRAYGQEALHQQRFEASSAESRQISLALQRLSALLNPLTEVGYLVILCGIIAGAGVWNAGFATTLTAVALLYRLQPHTRELESKLLYIAQIQPQLRSVTMMLRRHGKDYPPVGHRAVASLSEGVRFDRVSFRYDPESDLVLDGVTFDIPAGKTTALVGASGAGKTTVVNLLLRLYGCSTGTVRVDGVPIDELSRTDWLGLLAVAGQDVDLIEGTVIDNIRMADSNATEDEVIAASEVAGVSEFVENLPDGYETWVGQQGLRFSGGQRQRIGLARAILRDPQFLILDEAMSALDRGLEDRIRHAIDERFPGRTILLITHRLETVRNAEHIVWIEQGRLVAQGSPDELMADATASLSAVVQ